MQSVVCASLVKPRCCSSFVSGSFRLCCVLTGSWASVTVSAPLSGPSGWRQRELAVTNKRKLHLKCVSFTLPLLEREWLNISWNKTLLRIFLLPSVMCMCRLFLSCTSPSVNPLSQNYTPSVCAFATLGRSRRRASICTAFIKRCGSDVRVYTHSRAHSHLHTTHTHTQRGRPGLPWQQRRFYISWKHVNKDMSVLAGPSEFLIGWHSFQSLPLDPSRSAAKGTRNFLRKQTNKQKSEKTGQVNTTPENKTKEVMQKNPEKSCELVLTWIWCLISSCVAYFFPNMFRFRSKLLGSKVQTERSGPRCPGGSPQWAAAGFKYTQQTAK